jgi:hypothetical protein
MPTSPRSSSKSITSVCQWIDLHSALKHYATSAEKTESQEHIKPLHWYVACRLVLEGGFRPDDIVPHPPFTVLERKRKGRHVVQFDQSKATGGERTVLGGLKTKNVDVVVTKNGLGPVMTVSCKGATGAFRNLTNRLEEAVGDCTNLHITYPAMVTGYLFVVRANRQQEEAIAQIESDDARPARKLATSDIAIRKGGEPVQGILRFHSALRELSGRRGIRDDVSRYEAVTLVLVESGSADPGAILTEFPPVGSPLRVEEFFQTLYLRYDERFVYGAPQIAATTRRLEWSPESPVFSQSTDEAASYPTLDYVPRGAAG